MIGGAIGSAGGDQLASLVQMDFEHNRLWRPRIRGSAVLRDPVPRGARHSLVEQVRERLFAELDTLS